MKEDEQIKSPGGAALPLTVKVCRFSVILPLAVLNACCKAIPVK